MRSYQQLVNLRIRHVVIMLATAVFIYQYSQWDDALWIPISVLAIIGPFRPGLSVNKAKERVIGSLAGLLLSMVVWLIIHYSYSLLPVIAILLVYCIAFCVLRQYTYFILLVTVMLCINFDYLNLSFNNELTYVVNRGICVLTGITICLAYEYWIFRPSYTNSVGLVESERLDKLITSSWSQIKYFAEHHEAISVANLNQCLSSLAHELESLSELKLSCQSSYSKQDLTIELIERYEHKLSAIFIWLSKNGFKLLTADQNLSIFNASNANKDEWLND